jgi:hypothetical protein
VDILDTADAYLDMENDADDLLAVIWSPKGGSSLDLRQQFGPQAEPVPPG